LITERHRDADAKERMLLVCRGVARTNLARKIFLKKIFPL